MATTNTDAKPRVMVGHLTYLKRGLVAHYLENEGFEIVPSTPRADELVRVVGIEQPDALVLDSEMVDEAGADTIEALHTASPATKVLLITSGGTHDSVAEAGADAYVGAGVELATIVALLRDLCGEPAFEVPGPEAIGDADSEPERAAESASEDLEGDKEGEDVTEGEEGEDTVPLFAPVGAAVALAAAGEEGPASAAAPEQEAEEGGKRPTAWMLSRALLWTGIGIIALSVFMAFLGGEKHEAAAPGASTVASGQAIVSPEAQTALDKAFSILDELVAALQAGRFVEAKVDAQLLMDQREAVRDAGSSLSKLDPDITSALKPFADDLTTMECTGLTDILGGLMPPCSTPQKGGGGGGGTLYSTGGSGGTVAGGGGGGGAGGGGGDGGGGGGGGGDHFPGQGAHLGWEHKPPHGGWHGHKPHR